MPECKYKKRLQFYLDGWTAGNGDRDIEEHLKQCPQCQVELAELEELSGAALEIVEQAPDREYWESFSTRVRNRIFSRSVTPVAIVSRPSRFLLFRLASLIVVILALAASTIILFRPEVNVPGNSPVAVSNPEQAAAPAPPSGAAGDGLALPESSRPSDRQAQVLTDPAPPTPILGALVSPEGGTAPNRLVVAVPLEIKDLSEQFRATPLMDRIRLELDTEAATLTRMEPILIDPSFRLRAAFVGQRLLAGLGMNAQNGNVAVVSGPLYGPSSVSPAFAWENFENDISSSWGYLRVASDTSKSNEIKKYFIELELMQAR